MKATGALAKEDHTFRVLVPRQDMTGAERSWASHYEIDDVVRYTRGSKTIGIDAGSYASVAAINPAANQLTVEKANGELATYDPRRLTGVSVYQEIERQFSVGDRIQFTAPDKSLGVANRELATIETVDPNGRLSARLVDNRQIDFNPSEHRHFDHGYAVTSHSSQGLTAERVLVHADTSVHPDLLNSRFGYVSISRASHERHTLHRRHGKTCPPVGSRCLEDFRLGTQPIPIRSARTRDSDLTRATIYDGGVAMTKMTTIPDNYNNIRAEIVELLKAARSTAARNVNSIMTATYWEIGRRIVEQELKGEARANYGEQLLELLAKDLTK